MLNFNFNETLTDFLHIISSCAKDNNLNIYIVGGAIRDNILKCPVKDIDLILEGNAIEFSKILPNEISVVSLHEDFCTVKVKYNQMIFDIASTRQEIYPNSGCLPVVTKVGVGIDEDVLRRDFTVNSLYCKLIPTSNSVEYQLIDLVSGMSDIENKRLKVLHSESYIDDPTRIIRGLGLKYRLGFEFDNYNVELINKYLSNIDYSNMSVARIKMVFKDVFEISGISIFNEIIEKKYYKIIQPLNVNVDFLKLNECLEIFKPDSCQTADFLMDIIENSEVDSIQPINLTDILKHFNIMPLSKIAYYYYKTGDELVLKYKKLKSIKINLTGDDLLKLGYKPGKIFSEIFNKILEKKLENPINIASLNQEIEFIKNIFPVD